MKRSALLIGLDQEGKVLLHHKSADAPTNANLWVLIGGSIESGEDPARAMVREAAEEFEIEIKPNFFKKYTHQETWGVVERHIFYNSISETIGRLRIAQKEGDDVGFFSLEEMTRLDMNKNHAEIIGEFFKSSPHRERKRLSS